MGILLKYGFFAVGVEGTHYGRTVSKSVQVYLTQFHGGNIVTDLCPVTFRLLFTDMNAAQIGCISG